VLYRAAVENVPVREYTLSLGKADIVVKGKERHVAIWCETWSHSDESYGLGVIEDEVLEECLDQRERQ
jgi:pyruvate/2-oxoglutarate/acetoin dehydrogenase E1 component